MDLHTLRKDQASSAAVHLSYLLQILLENRTSPLILKMAPSYQNRLESKIKTLREFSHNHTVSGGLLDPAQFPKLIQDSIDLSHEFLLFLNGVQARRQNLDRGMCRIGDALLAQLDSELDLRWKRLTVPTEADEYLGHSEIICLRFFDCSIWNLPIVAHEMGHAVGLTKFDTEVRNIARADEWLSERERKLREKNPYAKFDRVGIVHEQFADLIGVYFLGPAFVSTSLLFRLQPEKGETDKGRYMRSAKRAYTLLRTLERIFDNRSRYDASWKPMFRNLESIWRERLKAADVPPPSNDEQQELQWRMERMETLLQSEDKAALQRIWISHWCEIRETARNLRTDSLSARQVSLPILLNAAWLARVENVEPNWRSVESQILQYCETAFPSDPRFAQGCN